MGLTDSGMGLPAHSFEHERTKEKGDLKWVKVAGEPEADTWM
jgi:hypothetical protein